MRRMHNWLLTLLMIIGVSTQAQTSYQTTSDAKFRKGPGAGYKSIGVIKTGDTLYVYDISNPAWFKVEYKGKLGFVSSKFLLKVLETPIDESLFKKEEVKAEASDNGSIWSIGVIVFVIIVVMVYSREKRKNNTASISPPRPAQQSQSLISDTSLPSYNPRRNESQVMNIVNTQEKEDDPSVIDVNKLGYSVQIFIGRDARSQSQENIDNNQHDSYSSNYSFENSLSDESYWGLGTKYQEKLQLSNEQVEILNRQWAVSNNFCSIEYCCEEVVKLFILTLKKLDEKYQNENSSLSDQVGLVTDAVLRKHFRYQFNSYNYTSGKDSVSMEIYTVLFKYCENAVRNHYGHRRKLNTDAYFESTTATQTAFETRLILPLRELLPTLTGTITPPDEETELELNAQNTSRWKDSFENISEVYKQQPSVFLEQVIRLGELNRENPSIEHIFFEASKFIAKADKEVALTLYVHYLYHDLKSATVDNKQLTKTIQKSIFKTNDQLKDFEVIVGNLIRDRNLENALKAIPAVFSVKRRRIKLDNELIKEAQLQDSEAVELLNEYLKDEYEDDDSCIKAQETGGGELSIQIISKSAIEQKCIYVETVHYTAIHVEVLEVFSKSSFSVVKKELESLLKPRGIFANQVVESINEVSYELLDDLLIEEEDDCLTINPDYYQRIIAK